MDEVKSINRIILPGTSNEAPSVPDWFRERLRQMDPTLCITWNGLRRRFVIEQCTEHFPDGQGEHTHVCRRSYVLFAQDPDGAMMPLGERVLEMIRERDVTKAGYGPEDLDRFIREQNAKAEQEQQRIAKERREDFEHAAKDGKAQLGRAKHLIDQHSLDVNR